MYMRVQKSLYVCLKSALLFYEKLVGDLEAHSLEVNPYRPCIANKIVEGKQLMITYNVDDLNIYGTPIGKSYQTPWYGWSLSMERCTVPAASNINT